MSHDKLVILPEHAPSII